jgi:hypothetical protein
MFISPQKLFFVNKKRIYLFAAKKMDALVKAMGKICFAEKIYKNEPVFSGVTHIDEKGYMVVTYASRIAYVKEIENINAYGRKWELL